MAVTEHASFTLTLFELTSDGQLRLAGRWTGVEANALSQARLILHTPDGVQRLEAISGSFEMDDWRAVFSWHGDLERVERVELELATLVVELPVPHPGRGRRFTPRRGRRSTSVRMPMQEPEKPRGARAGAVDDGDVLALHAAMVAAQDEAAEAREERARLLADVQHAREDAKREREQRESDVVRLREAITGLRRLAEDSLKKEREATRVVSVELREQVASVSTLRAEIARLHEETEASASARAGAEEQLRRQVDEIGSLRGLAADSVRLRSELADMRDELQRAADERNRLRRILKAVSDALDDD